MDKHKETDLSVSDAENRRPGGVVPAPGSSSSCDGPQTSVGLPTGPPAGYATAVVKLRRVRTNKPSTSKAGKDPHDVPISNDEDGNLSDVSIGSECSHKRRSPEEEGGEGPSGSYRARGAKSRRTSIPTDDDYDHGDSDASDMSSVLPSTESSTWLVGPKHETYKRLFGNKESSATSSSSTLAGDTEAANLEMLARKHPLKVVYDELTNDELLRLGNIGLTQIEEIRKTTANSMNGELNGRLRMKATLVREVHNTLFTRMEEKQDTSTSFMRMRINQLSSQTRESTMKLESLRQDYLLAQETISSLTKELKKAKGEIKQLKRLQQKEEEEEGTYLAPKPRSSGPIEDAMIMRPPLGGMSVPIPTREPKKARERDLKTRPEKREYESKTPKKSKTKPQITYAQAATSKSKPRVTEVRTVTGITVQRDPNSVKDRTSIKEGKWETVQRRSKNRTRSQRSKSRSRSDSRRQPSPTVKMKKAGNQKKRVVRRRVPKTAAVVITDMVDPMSSGKLLEKARKEIDLPSIGIENSKIRRAATGGMLIEIYGRENAEKADMLASKLRDIYPREEVKVSRPSVKGELKIAGFDSSVTLEELKVTLSKEGQCKEDDVKIGTIRIMSNGMGMAWAQCPLQSAVALTKKARLKVGWTSIQVELLKARPTQCFRCWRFGHLQGNCPFKENRSGYCFNCGGPDHLARDCHNAAHCVLCAEAKKDANHRLGSASCKAEKKSGAKVDFKIKPKPTLAVPTASTAETMEVG